ncbi:hypothetical protein PVAP13_2KG163180 [Panicum virgatum]|uniref:Uncharacterized protein n=1 Tax=Panicum virgatum TaxID=38727 RepID=A0A8T0W1G7_PANVG|nr:hypothetical protein PVAP13_2KG163180 [Panicum virgatum]
MPLQPRELLASAPAYHGIPAARVQSGVAPRRVGVVQANHQASGRTRRTSQNRGRRTLRLRRDFVHHNASQEDFLEGGLGVAAARLAGWRRVTCPPQGLVAASSNTGRGCPRRQGEQSWGVAAVVGVTAGVGLLGEVAAPGRGEGGDEVVTRRSERVAVYNTPDYQ